MNLTSYHLENYRKFLLNRVTCSPHIIEYMEHCLASEDEAPKHTFHKLMIHNWVGTDAGLFDAITEYFGCSFVPVNCTTNCDITSFYTSSLNLVLKIAKLDFLFPHQRNMFTIDILFNDRTSADCFENRITIEEIVTGVVSNRLNEKLELNLSNFSNDPEFIENKIQFYKVSLLSYFKILMLRMGRDARTLNLSYNNLSYVPLEILNFFIKGNLVAIKLNNNNIKSISELQKLSSKIEKLWVEENPLCEDIDALTYVKPIALTFPRLKELDGVKINEHGVLLPFFKNYLETPEKRTKMLVEKFMSLYFASYDLRPRNKIDNFYDASAILTISTDIKEVPGTLPSLTLLSNHGRNFLSQGIQNPEGIKKIHKSRIYNKTELQGVFANLPETTHDPGSFTVDVLKNDKKALIIVIDGIFKQKSCNMSLSECYLQFRRTFVFSITIVNNVTEYLITNEMFSVTHASKEQIQNSFKNPAMITNPRALRNPDQCDINALCYAFSHVTNLNKSEAELRLRANGWDMTKALKEFLQDLKQNKVPEDRFAECDFSDTSSLMDVDDEID